VNHAAGGQGVRDEVPGDGLLDAGVAYGQVRLVAPAGVADQARVLEQPGRGDGTLIGSGGVVVVARDQDRVRRRRRQGPVYRSASRAGQTSQTLLSQVQ